MIACHVVLHSFSNKLTLVNKNSNCICVFQTDRLLHKLQHCKYVTLTRVEDCLLRVSSAARSSVSCFIASSGSVNIFTKVARVMGSIGIARRDGSSYEPSHERPPVPGTISVVVGSDVWWRMAITL